MPRRAAALTQLAQRQGEGAGGVVETEAGGFAEAVAVKQVGEEGVTGHHNAGHPSASMDVAVIWGP